MDIDFARPYFGDEERAAVNRVMVGHWLGSGPETEAFEQEFACYVNAPYALAVNSGSSANLLALACLNLAKGSKVLTSGCGFPATLAPILHLGLEPVLVDYEMPSFNIDVAQVVERLRGVRAIIFAHTMGNPVDVTQIAIAAREYGTYVIEDCCEAFGASLKGKQVGSIGDIGTFSFYPSHQITALGGGGMMTFDDERFYLRAKSMRDWGKLATWDKLGQQNTTYSVTVDAIPYFPHYVYETVGYNFRLPEANSAFGREQLKRADWITQQRRRNHHMLLAQIKAKNIETAWPLVGAEPSWFGVILHLKTGNRKAFGEHLEAKGVRHRPFFAGNITRHYPFRWLAKPLPVADKLMNQTVFVGCWAGLTDEQVSYMAEVINEAAERA